MHFDDVIDSQEKRGHNENIQVQRLSVVALMEVYLGNLEHELLHSPRNHPI